jgi:hypothetical protein
MSTHFFNKAGVVIIKAHTPGAKRSSNAPDPYLCVRSFQFRRIEVWDTLTTNRKIVLILDRYIAVHLTRTIFLILYNPS